MFGAENGSSFAGEKISRRSILSPSMCGRQWRSEQF